MDQVIARQEINTVVIPGLNLPKPFPGAYVHIRTDHQITSAVVLPTDIGITRSTLDTGHLGITEHRVALEQVVIMKAIATQGIGCPRTPTIVHVTIQITIVTFLQIPLL